MKGNFLNWKPKHVAQLPKNGFDMSQQFGFTSSTGMLLPVYYDFLRVGESVHFQGSLFARSQPLVTAAMADVDVFVDWFFVPSQMLFLNLGSFMWETNDLISSAVNPLISQQGLLPVVDFNASLYGLMNASSSASERYSQSWFDAHQSLSITIPGEDDRFDCVGVSTFRLLNHLGYNPNGIFAGDPGSYNFQHDPTNPNVFPMFLLAYQAIYQDYFRIDNRERRNLLSFNMDYEDANGVSVSNVSSNNADRFHLHYRPMKLDYFTSVKPTPIMDSVNMLGSINSSQSIPSPSQVLQKIDNYLGVSSNSFVDYNPVLGNDSSDNTASVSTFNMSSSPAFSGENNPDAVNVRYQFNKQTTGIGINSNISTANIRSMFAVEKLLRITGRARKDYDSQVLAHFGFNVPHDAKHELTHLGTDQALMHIGEVTSTADTFSSASSSGAALGSISGKGYVNIQGKKRKFTAPVDGVLMAIYSCVPRVRYFGTFDKLNSFVDRLSFVQPEYDRLGMQPLFAYEAEQGLAGVSSNRCGWQYRYEQYKRKYDRVTEAFSSPVYYGQVNQYSAWVLGRLPYKPSGSIVNLSFDDFLCPPTALNSIMVMPYSTAWDAEYIEKPWLMFARDPFINDFSVHCTKVSTMSKYGEPALDF